MIAATISSAFDAYFCRRLDAAYAGSLVGAKFMVNELYLALCYRPTAGLAGGVLARMLTRTRLAPEIVERADALDHCAKLGQTVRASLARYEPERSWWLSARNGVRWQAFNIESAGLRGLAYGLEGALPPLPSRTVRRPVSQVVSRLRPYW